MVGLIFTMLVTIKVGNALKLCCALLCMANCRIIYIFLRFIKLASCLSIRHILCPAHREKYNSTLCYAIQNGVHSEWYVLVVVEQTAAPRGTVY